VPLPGGQTLVILNPRQTAERAAVTAVEEFAHAHYGHAPSRLERLPSGLVCRDYDAQAEREAYWTAAATLLPSEVVARAVWRRVCAEELATTLGVSTQLVEFRIKVLRLWKYYTTPLAEAS
jgi:Zn-dependent peptidase ImmA (M78 family)